MKKLLLLLALLTLSCSTLQSSNLGVAITTATTSGTVARGAKSVTFIFGSTFTGTIGDSSFAGSTDSSLHIVAPTGDIMLEIPYTVTAGTVRIVVLQ